MNKSDLKAGYTLVDEKKRMWYLLNTENGLIGLLIKNESISYGDTLDLNRALNDDLTIKQVHLFPSSDIVKVYGFPKHISHIFSHYGEPYINVKVLWERRPKKTIQTFNIYKFIRYNTTLSTPFLANFTEKYNLASYHGKLKEVVVKEVIVQDFPNIFKNNDYYDMVVVDA